MRIRRFFSWAAVAVTALAAVFGGASPAAAGAPTGVMLVAWNGKAAAITAGAPGYQELEQSVGEGPEAEPPKSLSDVTSGQHRRITLTWLIHNVSVWRVDHVYPDGPGGAWVHRRTATGTDLPEQGTWHKAPRSEELRRILDRLGLIRDAASDPLAGPQDTAVAQETPVAAPQVAAAGDGGPDDWWIALAGLGVGLAVGCPGTLLALRLTTRRTPGEPGPRQELIDI